MRQRGGWRFDAFLGCDFQSAFERELNLACGFRLCARLRRDESSRVAPCAMIPGHSTTCAMKHSSPFSAEYQIRIS